MTASNVYALDGDISGFKIILEKLSKNDENHQLIFTHKQVRAYARCLLNVLPALPFSLKEEQEIKLLLVCISSSGLPHYDRAFMATKVLELVKIFEESRATEKQDEFF